MVQKKKLSSPDKNGSINKLFKCLDHSLTLKVHDVVLGEGTLVLEKNDLHWLIFS